MSKLEELINQLCPDGVEYVKIKECIKSVKNIKWKEHEDQKFHYIDLASVDRETHSVLDTQIITSANAPSRAQQIVECNDVLLGTTRPMLKRFCLINDEYSGEICSTGFCVLRPNLEKILPAWLLHNISSDVFFAHVEKFQKGASYPAITDAEVKTFCIPLPPLPVQEEIVRILDNMTSLTAELTEKLAEEKLARQKQYEYYLNSLLSFDEGNAQDGVRWMRVGELFEFKNGLNKGKDFFGKGTPIVNFTDVFKNACIYEDTLKGRVEVTTTEMERYSAKKGDVFFTRTSETPEEIGMTAVLLDDIPDCVFSGFVLRARPKTELLLPKYCGYCFSSREIRKEIVRTCTYTTRALTNGTTLSKLRIPVPPLEEQQRIVDILDRFDKLCNDISEGLPAEIEARKKQYEYYRDKLLTFREKEG